MQPTVWVQKSQLWFWKLVSALLWVCAESMTHFSIWRAPRISTLDVECKPNFWLLGKSASLLGSPQTGVDFHREGVFPGFISFIFYSTGSEALTCSRLQLHRLQTIPFFRFLPPKISCMSNPISAYVSCVKGMCCVFSSELEFWKSSQILPFPSVLIFIWSLNLFGCTLKIFLSNALLVSIYTLFIP